MTTQNKPDPALEPIQDVTGLPRVLLIGDSISIGYTLPVRELLHGKANLHRPPCNCRTTLYGMENLDAWLGDAPWDVIHFNWGLHDIVPVEDQGERTTPENGRHRVPIDQYENNLNSLVERLTHAGASLIWCATTPVPDGVKRKRGDEILYNAAAEKIMRGHGIPINDLYAYALERLAYIQRPANVHFTPDGSAVLARAVAAHTIEALVARPAAKSY